MHGAFYTLREGAYFGNIFETQPVTPIADGSNCSLLTPSTTDPGLAVSNYNEGCGPLVINNLDGSGGLIKNHSDITSDAVTYAFAAALART